MGDVFQERTRRLQQWLVADGADAAVFFPSPNCYYLTGFWEAPMERHLLVFVPATGDPEIVAPELYESQLADETWITSFRTYPDGADPVERIETVAETLGLEGGRILLDPTMWARFSLDLRRALPGASFELAADAMAALRRTKDDPELERIESASDAADAVMAAVRELGTGAVGMTEADLAAWIRDELLDRGDEIAFDVVVGSGPNGAKPHHRHGDRTIRSGEPVVLDFGVRHEHYPSDTTRTLVFDGSPSERFEIVHDVVREAQQTAVERVQPGIAAETIDEAARTVIEDRGYGDAFVHRTGHGVGLDVHEEPYLVAGNGETLEPGMVFSVEPGIYLEGEFGVRIEDLVVVTESGARRLNSSSRGWTC